MTQPFTLTGTYRRDKSNWFTITDPGQSITNFERFQIAHPGHSFSYSRSFNFELTSPTTFDPSNDDTYRQAAHDLGVSQGGDPAIGADFLLKGNYVHSKMDVSYVALSNDITTVWGEAYYAGSPSSFNPSMGTITRNWVEIISFFDMEGGSPVAIVDGDSFDVILYDKDAAGLTLVRTALGTASGKSATDLTVSSISLSINEMAYVMVAFKDDTYYTSPASVTVGGYVAFDAGDFGGSQIAFDGIRLNIFYVEPRFYNIRSISGDVVVTFPSAVTAAAIAVTKVTPVGDTGGGVGPGAAGTGSSDTPSRTFDSFADVNFCIAAVATKGPSEDADGSWDSGFTAGQIVGTTGGSDDDNIKISEGYKITTSPATETPSKSGITSRRWIMFTYASPQTFAF